MTHIKGFKKSFEKYVVSTEHHDRWPPMRQMTTLCIKRETKVPRKLGS